MNKNFGVYIEYDGSHFRAVLSIIEVPTGSSPTKRHRLPENASLQLDSSSSSAATPRQDQIGILELNATVQKMQKRSLPATVRVSNLKKNLRSAYQEELNESPDESESEQ